MNQAPGLANAPKTQAEDYWAKKEQQVYQPINNYYQGQRDAAATQQPAPGPSGPSAADIQKMIDDALARERAAQLQRQRDNVFDAVSAVLAQYGIDSDGNGLSALVRQWAQEDKSADWIKINLRDTTQYKARFPAMQELIKRGQAIDEMTYIAQEKAYRAVLSANELPTGFYDGPDDYARFIANDVSVKELQDRVTSAKTFLDTNTDSAYRTALSEYYGISDGQMLAWVLDGDRAQASINRTIKAAALGGAATIAGFDIDQSQAERFGATLGSDYDTFGVDQRNALQKSLNQLGQQASNDERLASIDQDQSFSTTDILEAGLLSDTGKQLASQQRNRREANRFGGRSAITQGSLTRNRGI
jgi:hypothetical protein